MFTTTHITRRKAAQIICAHPRTISRNIELKDLDRVPIKAFAEKFCLDASFLDDALAGRDHAVTLQQAAEYLGLDSGAGNLALGERARSYKLLRPVARLGKGLRFSAQRLGMFPREARQSLQ